MPGGEGGGERARRRQTTLSAFSRSLCMERIDVPEEEAWGGKEGGRTVEGEGRRDPKEGRA